MHNIRRLVLLAVLSTTPFGTVVLSQQAPALGGHTGRAIRLSAAPTSLGGAFSGTIACAQLREVTSCLSP